MRYSVIWLFLFLFLTPVNPAVAGDPTPGRKNLVTAEDLLRQRHLSLYRPSTQSAVGRTGFITAEDLLRQKGLLKDKDKNEKNNGKKEDKDIWELGKDLGC